MDITIEAGVLRVDIDLDVLCCGEWSGLYTQGEWEEWKAAQPE